MAAGAAVAGFFALKGAAASIVAGAVNGAIVGAAVGAVSAAVNGENVLEGMGKGALAGAATGAIAGGISFAFNNAGAAATPPNGTNVTQTGTQVQSGAAAQAPTTPTPTPETGVIPTSAEQPAAVSQMAAPAAPNVPGGGGAVTDNQYLLTLKEMQKESLAMQQETGKQAFYREAASGAVQAGLGAYADKKAAEEEAALEREKMASDLASRGVLERQYAAPTVAPEYAAERPQVTAPTAGGPMTTQVGVARPTADIRNITVRRAEDKGVLPNG